jgi:hypothetical protein
VEEVLHNAIGYKKFLEIADGPDSPDLAWHTVVDGKLFAVISFIGSDGIRYRRALCGEELGPVCPDIVLGEPRGPVTDGVDLWYVADNPFNWKDGRCVLGPDRPRVSFCDVPILCLYRRKALCIGTDIEYGMQMYYGDQLVWRPPYGLVEEFRLHGDRLSLRGSGNSAQPTFVIDDLRIFLRLPIHEPPKTGPYR